MPPKKRTTIYDIANKLGITPSSVSRALNDKAVNAKTKKLILQTAKEMNYKKNSLASNLRKGESTTIGVVVPRINQNFFSNVIAGIETETYKKGHNLIICQSDESYEKEKKCINMLINQHVNCIVISLSVETNDYQHLQSVLDQDIELIQFDRVADDVPSLKVINDNEQASFEAVGHMISQGYQRIALLEGPQNL
jgi:LacI family transcriptional regulator